MQSGKKIERQTENGTKHGEDRGSDRNCLSDRATLKEAYSALDFLYTLGLVDAELALRVSGQAVPFLLQKLKEGELARILLEPLLEVFALFALKNESTLSGLAFGVVSELTAVLLSFKGVRGIHEFLGSAGARAAGRPRSGAPRLCA